jgi:hypothetical protein
MYFSSVLAAGTRQKTCKIGSTFECDKFAVAFDNLWTMTTPGNATPRAGIGPDRLKRQTRQKVQNLLNGRNGNKIKLNIN